MVEPVRRAQRHDDRAGVDERAHVLSGDADGEVFVAVSVEVTCRERSAETVTGLVCARDFVTLTDDGEMCVRSARRGDGQSHGKCQNLG